MIIKAASKYFNIVIVRPSIHKTAGRTFRNLFKKLDSRIKSGNDKPLKVHLFVLCRSNSNISAGFISSPYLTQWLPLAEGPLLP